MNPPKLPLTTQHLLLNGIIRGKIETSSAEITDFDQDERIIFQSLVSLYTRETKPPITREILLDYIRHAQGKDPVPETVLLSLKNIESSTLDGDPEGLRRSILIRRGATAALSDLTTQLSRGVYDLQKVAEGLLLVERDAAPDGISVLQYLNAEQPTEGETFHCLSLPQLMNLTGNIRGIWVVAGAPGFGKSTLIMQMMMDLSYQGVHIYWFNFELDPLAIHDRIIGGWPSSKETMHKAVENIQEYKRKHVGNIKSLAQMHQDKYPGKRALFVIDTFQKLPVKTNYARQSFDSWLHTFEDINLEYGYPFILASQKDRKSYEEATLWGFKETSEIESSMTVGLQILPIEAMEGALELFIVKNRHKKYTGHCLNLFRKRDWWFREEVIV